MRVVVVSTHRSDKGHYAPLLRCLRATADLDVVLYAANDFYARPDYDRSVQVDNSWRGKNAEMPDAGIVLGDRYEMLLAAAQLVEARIPLLHIHGGEHTYGSLDERWRWAMSQLADVHCVATKQAECELLGLSLAERIHVTGAPGLDGITDRQPFPNTPKIVVLYNPAIDEETTRREVAAIREATGAIPLSSLMWVESNGDRFSDLIPRTITTLDSETFRDLLAAAHVIVGNSSAGIIEAPSLGTWTVNVGERQAGRPRATSIADVPARADLIRMQLEVVLKCDRPSAVANPYGDGHASERIRDVLLGMMSR